MSRHGKAVLFALIAALTLAMAADSALARNISLRTATRGFRIAWSEFRFNNEMATEQATCPITLEGTFHSSSFAKVFRAEIGQITRAATGVSARGTGAAVPATLPWSFQYEDFSGTLPLITRLGFRIVGAQFEIRWPSVGAIKCIATTTDMSPMETIAATPAEALGVHEISTMRLQESAQIRLGGEPPLCEAQHASLVGEGRTTVLGETERPRFTLI